MKKIISMLLLVIGFSITTASAQRASTIPVAAGDTTVNTDTASKVLSITAGYSGVIIQPIVSKVSGTVGGKVYLYESLDGTNYGAATDSITLSNQATNTGLWKKAAPNPVYYKISAITSGTQSSILTVKFVARKHD